MTKYFYLLFLFLSSHAYAQLSMDGHVTGNITHNASSGSVSLTTTSANNVIIVCVSTQNTTVTGAATVSALTVAGGSTMTKRTGQTFTSGAGAQTGNIEEWQGTASGTLTGASVSVTFSTTADSGVIQAFGIAGANTSSPFDANGSLPAINKDQSALTTQPTVSGISTTNANDMLISCMNTQKDATETAGTGYTLIDTQNNTGGAVVDTTAADEFQIVSSTQSSISATFGTNVEGWGMIVDAIQKAVAAGVTPTRSLLGVGQ